MKALLLAAGLGSRLLPITNHIPKCLVLIDGKPLIDYWIEELIKLDFEKIFINTHHLNYKVETHINNSLHKEKIFLIHEDKLLGTGGTLFKLRNELKDSMSLIAHADNYFEENLKNLINSYTNKPKDCLMTMMTFEVSNSKNFGIVKKNKKNIVTNFYEKRNVDCKEANAAIYCLDPKIFKTNYINSKLNDISLELIPKLINKINVYKTDKFYIDIGSHENLEIIKKRFLKK